MNREPQCSDISSLASFERGFEQEGKKVNENICLEKLTRRIEQDGLIFAQKSLIATVRFRANFQKQLLPSMNTVL